MASTSHSAGASGSSAGGRGKRPRSSTEAGSSRSAEARAVRVRRNPPPPVAAPPPAINEHHVLVVISDKDVQAYHRKLFRDRGCRVTAFDTSVRADEFMQGAGFDQQGVTLLVVDYTFPPVRNGAKNPYSGLDLYRFARRSPEIRDIPFVLLWEGPGQQPPFVPRNYVGRLFRRPLTDANVDTLLIFSVRKVQ